MEIYIDVLFLVNIVMNYLILFLTAKFSKRKTSNIRMLAGAIIGALYAVVMVLLPRIETYCIAFSKILISMLIVAAAFTHEKAVSFMKTLAIFYVSTFIFAGAGFAFLYFNQAGGFVRNGIYHVFHQSKWTLLFLSIVLVWIIIRIFWEMLQVKLKKESLFVRMKIAFDSKIIGIEALIDTGNSLKDPLTNMPVVVVEFSAISGILPPEIKNIFENSGEHDLMRVTDIISGTRWFTRFRLIPYTSLGTENGMLIGFKPDYIEIDVREEKKDIKEVIIGIYNRTLSKNDKYKALLSPELM